uniref:Lactate utilization protein n=1 Tax=Geobacter metallireducens TaxID=28232 RepID=A0A831U1I7_GEOME
MVDQFSTAAEAFGAAVKRFTSRDEAIAALRGIVAGRPAAASELPAEVRQQLGDLAHVPLHALDRAEVGISFASAGIAATGSLLLELSDPASRSATALPPIHAAFLKASAIVPDLYALSDTLSALLSSPGSRYLSIITGPSRTADIERVLTIGVHGPKELHILILEGE